MNSVIESQFEFKLQTHGLANWDTIHMQVARKEAPRERMARELERKLTIRLLEVLESDNFIKSLQP